MLRWLCANTPAFTQIKRLAANPATTSLTHFPDSTRDCGNTAHLKWAHCRLHFNSDPFDLSRYCHRGKHRSRPWTVVSLPMLTVFFGAFYDVIRWNNGSRQTRTTWGFIWGSSEDKATPPNSTMGTDWKSWRPSDSPSSLQFLREAWDRHEIPQCFAVLRSGACREILSWRNGGAKNNPKRQFR